jgi:hypothetical protein
MKISENYDDYLQRCKKNNNHPELNNFIDNLPANIYDMGNLIVYGPSGVGKYTQVLRIMEKYSFTHLKYDTKIKIQTEKNNYTYHISDIHYEIDMGLLGCNSKLLWHEIFLQITDIISMKQDKVGFIVCKNFHLIHGELLEIFYSYIQPNTNIIKIFFIILTENISFLPNNIIHSCKILNIGKPHGMEKETEVSLTNYFDIICNNIIKEIINIAGLKENKKTGVFANFREIIYDILVYNIEVEDCLWVILCFLINNNYIQYENMDKLFLKISNFLKYYNNNYRPIYHLESIFIYIILMVKENLHNENI